MQLVVKGLADCSQASKSASKIPTVVIHALQRAGWIGLIRIQRAVQISATIGDIRKLQHRAWRNLVLHIHVPVHDIRRL